MLVGDTNQLRKMSYIYISFWVLACGTVAHTAHPQSLKRLVEGSVSEGW